MTGILTEQKLISDCRYRVIESSSLVPVLFREVFGHPYISLFHSLVNGFSVIYKEPEDGNFEDATREILEAVSGDSNIDDDKEMEPVAAIAGHLADIINDIHTFSSKTVC